MAASSHDPGVQDLQYHAFQSNPDNHHLYTSLASWASPQNLLQASSSSPAMFQRPGPPAHYPQYSAPLDYANLHPIQTSWPGAGPYRPESSYLEGFSSRPTHQHGYTEAGPPAPQSDTTYTRSPASSRVHDLLQTQPQTDFMPTQREHELQFSSTYSAPSDATRFLPSGQGSAPVARLLNYPHQDTGALQVQPEDLASQTPSTWPTQTVSEVGPTAPHQYPTNHALVAFPPGMAVLPLSSNSTGASWYDTGGAASDSATPAIGRLHSVDSDWSMIEPRDRHRPDERRVSQLSLVSPGDYSRHLPTITTAVGRVSRRPGATQKLPTIPSPFVERQKKNTVSRRHGPLSTEKREKAHRMRQRGPDGKPPCIRCRFYKAGCDEGDPCSKCEKTSKSARVFHLPCSRDQIEDTNLVRRCNGRFNQPDADFLKYPWRKDRNIHIMEIIWNLPGLGPVTTTHPLRIKFREYEPEGGNINSTESQWQNTNGQLVRVEQPPYAVYDTTALQNDVEAYFTYNLPAVDRWIFGRNRHDEIALITYEEALRLRGQGGPGSELLNLALQLQYLSVVSQGYGSVWSNNIPGIKQYDFKAMGHSVYEAYDRNTCERPLPIAINHQMDVALVKFLKRLEEKCFKLLAKEIFKTGIRPWYELFLTLFVLFWNLEYIHSGAETYIKSKSGTHIARQVNNVVSQQIEKWDFSFEVLMNHWQGCLRGFKPFVLARENPEELRTKGRLPDQRAFEYMTRMASILDRQGPGRFPPPLSGFTSVTNSMASKWIMALIKEAGG